MHRVGLRKYAVRKLAAEIRITGKLVREVGQPRVPGSDFPGSGDCLFEGEMGDVVASFHAVDDEMFKSLEFAEF